MYIHCRPFAAFYKLTVGTLALVTEWFLLNQQGLAALRLFPTWVLFGAAIYFLSAALITAFNTHDYDGQTPCPLVEGILILSGLAMSVVTLLSANFHFYLPELSTTLVWLVSAVLPGMMLVDWLFFVHKGKWSAMLPFYALALPVCYLATMMLTAEMLPDNTVLLYPLEPLNFRAFGLWPGLQCLIVGSIAFLLAGYVLYMLDFAMSGKLSQYIVLPHLKVIEVDEDGNEITPAFSKPAVDTIIITADEIEKAERKIERKAAKKAAQTEATAIKNEVEEALAEAEEAEALAEAARTAEMEITKIILDNQIDRNDKSDKDNKAEVKVEVKVKTDEQPSEKTETKTNAEKATSSKSNDATEAQKNPTNVTKTPEPIKKPQAEK